MPTTKRIELRSERAKRLLSDEDVRALISAMIAAPFVYGLIYLILALPSLIGGY